MPASNGLQPQLEPAETEVVKDYGGWTSFSESYGLRPSNSDDNEEAHAIVRGLAEINQAEKQGKK